MSSDLTRRLPSEYSETHRAGQPRTPVPPLARTAVYLEAGTHLGESHGERTDSSAGPSNTVCGTAGRSTSDRRAAAQPGLPPADTGWAGRDRQDPSGPRGRHAPDRRLPRPGLLRPSGGARRARPDGVRHRGGGRRAGQPGVRLHRPAAGSPPRSQAVADPGQLRTPARRHRHHQHDPGGSPWRQDPGDLARGAQPARRMAVDRPRHALSLAGLDPQGGR